MENEISIQIRPANLRDARQLARLHYICSSVQPGAFMYRLGQGFLVEYYRLILGQHTSVVLCADAGPDGIVGLVSVTLKPENELEAMRRRRLRFLLAVLPAVVRSPALVEAVYLRNRSLSAKFLGEGFISHSCPRIAYWGWLPDYPSQGKSIALLIEIMRFMKDLGANKVQLEVDRINRRVEVVHRLLGAKVIREFTTSDGRDRIIMEYGLDPKACEQGKAQLSSLSC